MSQAASIGPSNTWGQLQNAIHLVTLRLEGVVPPHKLAELRVWRDEQLALAPVDPRLGCEFQTRIRQRFFTEYDYLLDENRDSILLADVRVAAMLRRQLMASCARGYRLLAYCVMPNHLHAVLELAGMAAEAEEIADERLDFVTMHSDEEPDERSPLAEFLRSFKRETATEAYALLDDGRELAWSPSSFDFWIRSEAELEAVVDYLAQNPVEAGLVQSPEQWFFCSAHERYLYDATTNGWLPGDDRP
jgi:putative DNA methylase